MVALTTKNIKIAAAEEFIEAVSEPASSNLYVVIGRNVPWANDLSPDVANDSIYDQNILWNNMITGKKITGNDLSHVIRRVNWAENTVYSYYDDRANNMYSDNVNFYVMTDEYNIYKCLNNNNGANSTIKPTYIAFNSTTTESDGYIWKYMYTLSTKDKVRFLTDEWIPIRKVNIDDGSLQYQVQQGAVDGAIESVIVSNSGTSYTNSSNILVTITGDGSGAVATAALNTMSNTVSTITITNKGLNYTYANVSITGGGGSGATARAIMSPFGGHGSNPMYELGGSTLMLGVRIRPEDENVFVPTNDFRQISILRNPLRNGTSNAFSNSAFTQLLELTVSGSGNDYVDDEQVFQGATLATSTFKGRVLKSNTITNTLFLTDYIGSPTSTNLFGLSSGAVKFVIQIQQPDLKPRSGEIIYIDNILPVTRTEDQIENIKIPIKF